MVILKPPLSVYLLKENIHIGEMILIITICVIAFIIITLLTATIVINHELNKLSVRVDEEEDYNIELKNKGEK